MIKKITLLLFLISCFPAFSQITLIDPLGDGGFETGPSFDDNGWSVANPAGANRKWYLGTGQEGYTGARAAFIGNNETTVGTGSQNRKVHLYRSVSIPAGAENIMLTFNYKQETSDVFDGEVYDYIAVYTDVATPSNNQLPSGDLQFGPFPEVDMTGFEMQTVTLPNNLAGTTTNLIFTFVGDNVAPNGYGAIDDVSLTYTMPTCAAPSNLSSSNITGTSADLTWDASVSSPSGGYEYYYSEDGTAPDGSTTPLGTSTDNTANIQGLTGSTAYHFWVRANCGGGDFSSWAGPLDLSTLCEAMSVPYAIGFEDGEESVSCLKVQNVNGGTTWNIYTNGGNGAATGTNSARYRKSANKPGDDWFYLVGLNLTGGQEYNLDFSYKSSAGPDLTENLEVKYGISADADAMTSAPVVTLEGINTAAADPFLTSSTTFTPVTTGVYYIGFHSYSMLGQGIIYVDDIAVSTALSTGTINSNSITHYPNPVKDVLNLSTKENIQDVSVYNILGQKVFERQLNTTDAQVNLSGLAAGNYLAKVRTDKVTQVIRIIKE